MIGHALQPAEVTSQNAWAAIHRSSKELLVTYESRGPVVSINGSGTLRTDHPQAIIASQVAQHVVSFGGMVLTGGRNSGIMQAVATVAQKNLIGIIFPELENQLTQHGETAIVNSPTPRIELLSTCAPIIVILRGGLGTLMLLMRSITHLNNRQYHPDQPEQLIFVSNYWVGLLTTMMNMGSLPREFLTKLIFFDRVEQITKRIPSV